MNELSEAQEQELESLISKLYDRAWSVLHIDRASYVGNEWDPALAHQIWPLSAETAYQVNPDICSYDAGRLNQYLEEKVILPAKDILDEAGGRFSTTTLPMSRDDFKKALLKILDPQESDPVGGGQELVPLASPNNTTSSASTIRQASVDVVAEPVHTVTSSLSHTDNLITLLRNAESLSNERANERDAITHDGHPGAPPSDATNLHSVFSRIIWNKYHHLTAAGDVSVLAAILALLIGFATAYYRRWRQTQKDESYDHHDHNLQKHELPAQSRIETMDGFDDLLKRRKAVPHPPEQREEAQQTHRRFKPNKFVSWINEKFLSPTATEIEQTWVDLNVYGSVFWVVWFIAAIIFGVAAISFVNPISALATTVIVGVALIFYLCIMDRLRRSKLASTQTSEQDPKLAKELKVRLLTKLLHRHRKQLLQDLKRRRNMERLGEPAQEIDEEEAETKKRKATLQPGACTTIDRSETNLIRFRFPPQVANEQNNNEVGPTSAEATEVADNTHQATDEEIDEVLKSKLARRLLGSKFERRC